MNLSMTEQFQYITVRIEVELSDGGLSTGTGFFFQLCESEGKHIPVVVTNKHVIAGGTKGAKGALKGRQRGILLDISAMFQTFIRHRQVFCWSSAGVVIEYPSCKGESCRLVDRGI